jgi:adenylate cyclase
MAEERVRRRLAAILVADMVGYSRLMESDESGTIARQKQHRQELIDPKFAEHHGRIVKTSGDGLLIEFASAVDAVQCAVEVQKAMAVRDADVGEDRRIRYRVGINLGDIVIDGDDILGDGVNVAARLEGLAPPGGICISGDVYRQIDGKLHLAFEDMGEQAVKNITKPIRVYRLRLDDTAWEAGTWTPSEPHTLALPDKPSIAVLPFNNMSGDPDQNFFADGIAEDITTALSRVKELFVIARNSAFSYRGQSPDIRRVGRELGVRYVLEGSVRRAASQIRLTAQLSETQSGNHVWAEKYDRPLTDVFAIQDEITQSVAGAVDSQIRATEMKLVARKHTEDLGSWERLMKALWHLNKNTEAGNATAREICLAEVARDPENHRALTVLSYGSIMDAIYGWGALSPAEAVKEAADAARASVAIEPKEEWTHGNLCIVLWLVAQHDAAIREGETAVELNPNYNIGHMVLGAALGHSGAEYYERAAHHLALAIRLDPRDIWVEWPHAHWSAVEIIAERYDAAIERARTAVACNPSLGLAHRVLAVALALKGDLEAARQAYTESQRVQPINIAAYAERIRAAYKRQSDLERYLKGLRLAGA